MQLYSFKKNVVFRKEEGGALLYNHDTGEILPLNESAADWCELLLENSFDMESAEKEMRKMYELEPDKNISGDMDEIIDILKTKGYVEPKGMDV